MSKHAEKAPSEVNAEQGEVIVDGPDGVAFSLTPDAAQRTARALRTAAREARRQQSDAASAPGELKGRRPDAA